MPKEAVFTMKLEPELRADFMAEAKASHRPASQLLRELMRDFVQRQKQAREYEDFVRGKVDLAREQIVNGQYASNEEVEARFAALRAEVLNNTGNKGG
ncbi:MAG: antitoxin of toxin-antitoxin stability system [Chromatiaceae bacterium]